MDPGPEGCSEQAAADRMIEEIERRLEIQTSTAIPDAELLLAAHVFRSRFGWFAGAPGPAVERSGRSDEPAARPRALLPQTATP